MKLIRIIQLIIALNIVVPVIAIGQEPVTEHDHSIHHVHKTDHFYIDVHDLGPGNVSAQAVEEAHKKDLEVQGRYHVEFHKYWVDEANGRIYCLSKSPDRSAIIKAHQAAHGLLPDKIFQVKEGLEEMAFEGKQYYLDVHELGAGNVTANAVAEAHKKDLEIQAHYGVNFINYWVDETTGTVICLSQASDSAAVINTHRHAHGLLPEYIAPVTQGE